MTATVLFAVLILLLFLGMPVAFAIGLSTLAAMWVQGLPFVALAQKVLTGIDSFPLMALPFFLLAAELMTGGSLADVLLRLAAGLEKGSEHPLAHAILLGAEARGLHIPEARGFQSVTGKGVTGMVRLNGVVIARSAIGQADQ